MNIIKNPDFIFDVQKSNVIDASLSVIAQMFMDSCAAGTHQLTKDSPSSKLLFYRDVQKYKQLVEKYYDAIASQSSVSINDLDRTTSAIKEHEEQVNLNFRRTILSDMDCFRIARINEQINSIEPMFYFNCTMNFLVDIRIVYE